MGAEKRGKVVPLVASAPTQAAQRMTRTSVDTILITPEIVRSWADPPFQRPKRINEKVRALSERLKTDGGVLPGIITLGRINGVTYLLDGQHRREAFLMSGIAEGYTDIRTHEMTSMADMADEFLALNQQLVRLRPDDILRGLEQTEVVLQTIRKKAPFVGYDNIRRSERGPIISMTLLLRCWIGSGHEVPRLGKVPTVELASSLTDDECNCLCQFLAIAITAWGRDPEYARLWNSLNLTICMWLYRRLVVSRYSIKTKLLNRDQFTAAMQSLSASPQYLQWLTGRVMRENDRAPCYSRVKTLVTRSLQEQTGDRRLLPSPPWSNGYVPQAM